jgi:FixJ family two-component response regulator
MAQRQKLCDLTVPEIQKYIELCNFTDEELQLFRHKVKDKTNVQIIHSMRISESKITTLMKRIRRKMKAVEQHIQTNT